MIQEALWSCMCIQKISKSQYIDEYTSSNWTNRKSKTKQYNQPNWNNKTIIGTYKAFVDLKVSKVEN